MKNKFTASCSKCGKPVAALTGETNMHNGKWVTEHTTAEACKAAAPSSVGSRPNFSGIFSGGGYGYGAWDGMDDDYDDNPYGPFSTSEDVNPNEGSK